MFYLAIVTNRFHNESTLFSSNQNKMQLEINFFFILYVAMFIKQSAAHVLVLNSNDTW